MYETKTFDFYCLAMEKYLSAPIRIYKMVISGAIAVICRSAASLVCLAQILFPLKESINCRKATQTHLDLPWLKSAKMAREIGGQLRPLLR